MNPKRARVDCGGAAAYLVPYPALAPAPRTDRSSSEG